MTISAKTENFKQLRALERKVDNVFDYLQDDTVCTERQIEQLMELVTYAVLLHEQGYDLLTINQVIEGSRGLNW